MTLIYIGFGIVVIASFITGIILTKKENKNSNNASTNTSNNEVSTTLNNSVVQNETIVPTSAIPVTDNSTKKKLMYFIKGTEPSSTDQTFDEKNSNYTAS